MTVAVVYFKELRKEDLVWALLQAGFDVQIMDSEISIYSTEKDDALKFEQYIKENQIDAVFTYDFCPALSDGCSICSIPYVSWVYDCPLQTLYENSVSNDCNYIFSFDKKQVETIRQCGGKHAYYQHLGTNVFRNSAIVITDEDEKKYSCNVSFIGNLFSDGIYDLAGQVVDEATKQEYQNIIDDAYGKWDGIDRIHGRLSEQALDKLTDLDRGKFNDKFKMPLDDFFCSTLISYKLADLERTDMLGRLAKYGMRFYTYEKNVNISGIVPQPPLNYMDELPKAYALSKININITLHSITSGIPLRVFDIMGVGGFVLSNYQPEIEELFDIGKEIVVYRTLDELEDKVQYYLSHDDERRKIALNGYFAVKERFDNQKIVNDMLIESCL
ncbi:CgeB family protein [Butyrivibrio sp. YAB3001]|uniref:CgeB family protein n=1 Tax=Butyrivibrio sp. YAB3001 TaxID=1520812 RepID=UPI0008F66772|nr:glycosyltransferase [Butyrivibrio sp. YAB3001]SFB93884.1 Glycosyl transferases group 1 [Butyrivibrio sp. YAB3001]